MRLFEGARVMTATTGTIDIVFDSGCRVALKASEVFSVSDANCKALVASRAGAAGGLPVAAVPSANAMLIGFGVAGAAMLIAGDKQSGS
jgi:hypothetical protein